MLLQELKNQLLRIVGWALAGFGLLLLALSVIWRLENSTLTEIWGVLLLGTGVSLEWAIRRWPGRNIAAWILMGFSLGMHVATYHEAIRSTGAIQTTAIMLFPILAFFLVGKWKGLALCVVLLASMALLLPFHGWNDRIYGDTGLMFLLLYALAVGFSFILSHIHERHLERIVEISMTDPVTSLPNRGGFLVRLKASVQAGMPFQLVFMDLDHFRQVNMILGSREADLLLRNVAELLSRDPDVRDLARDYGDEFVWIHDGTPERLEGICEAIQRGLRELSAEMHLAAALSGSFGATVFPRDGKNHTELWAQAELALKKAKQAGRRCLRFYLAQDGAFEKSQGELLSLLEKAIEENRIQVHYQPKICMEKEQVCGMEALVRWTDPQRGYIPPNQFIPIAEQVGLIHGLGDLINARTLTFLGKLRQAGYRDMQTSINLSPAQLLRGDLCTKLIGLCMLHDVPTTSVVLEITEGILANPEAQPIIQELRDSGFQISLDDFGTGYSSLSYLHRFPITELKIDKSFADGLLQSEKQRRIFEGILHLSRELGLHTVVEGVEKWDQIQYIHSKGRIQVQGWFFARAMSEDLFLEFIRKFQFQEALEKGKP